MTNAEAIDALYRCVQTRPLPEDVAEIVLSALQPPAGRLRTLLDRAAARSVARMGKAYTSMARDFHRPTSGLPASVGVAAELFSVESLLPQDCLDLGRVEAFVRQVSASIRKDYGASDFKQDRLNRQQRGEASVRSAGRRAYNKRFRLLCRMEEKIRKLAREELKHELSVASKSAFASQVPKEDLGADLRTACFVAYQASRMSMRSTFTNGSQVRAFDEVSEALLRECRANEDSTRWDVVASVLTDSHVVRRLTDEQRGVLLGRAWGLLEKAGGLLAECDEAGGLDLEDMVVHRGNDSSTWNAAAGGWNKAREQYVDLLYATGNEALLDELCPGKVLRLMAADVVRWHSASRGGSSLHPDTAVWRDLPRPWRVVSGESLCSREMVEAACRRHGVDPATWTKARTSRTAVPFTPTPELVHGVSVSSPALAAALRKAGVFSGKKLKGKVPEFAQVRDPSGAVLGVLEVGEDDESEEVRAR